MEPSLTRLDQAYLRTKEGDSGAVIDYRNWQLSLGRRVRSLKLWFVLRSYGVEGFKKHIASVRPRLLISSADVARAV